MVAKRQKAIQKLSIFLTRSAFTLFALLMCLTPSLKQGIFPKLTFGQIQIAGKSIPLGVELVIVSLIMIGYFGCILSGHPELKWRWGNWITTVPVIGFGLVTLIRSWPIHQPSVALITVCNIGLFWSVYFFTLQMIPHRWIIGFFGILLFIQGFVGVMQVIKQGSVGLTLFKEPSLDPAIHGISVIETGETRWLRAYGLTPHPNFLGGYLGISLLLCLGAFIQNPRQRWLLPVLAVGSFTFILTFSRSAWLGLFLALGYFVLILRPWQRINWHTAKLHRSIMISGILGILILMIMGVLLREFLIARFLNFEQMMASSSVQERIRDSRQAWMLIRHLPLQGVGTGYYVDALWAWANTTGREYPAFQPVHNLPLLVTAEMGIGGLLFWLWLLIGPPVKFYLCRTKNHTPLMVAWAAVFILLFTVNLLDFYLYIPKVWWSSLIIGLLLGGWARFVSHPDEHKQDETSL